MIFPCIEFIVSIFQFFQDGGNPVILTFILKICKPLLIFWSKYSIGYFLDEMVIKPQVLSNWYIPKALLSFRNSSYAY